MAKRHNEGDDNPNFRHGMFQDTDTFSHTEKLRIFESAEDYIEDLGGAEGLYEHEKYDCYLLALTEYRIARAEGIMFSDVEHYLNEGNPERNLDTLVDRRQQLRKDLGLLRDSPEQKQAENAGGFFGAMAEDSSTDNE